MSQRRYLTSFLISALAFLILGLLLLSIPKAEKKLTATPLQLIKISILTPIKPVKKVIKPMTVPVSTPKVIVPPTPVVKKSVVKRPIVKKPIIKKVVKHKPKKKLVVRKPKPKPKKIVKKIKPKKIVKKVVKKVVKKSKPKAVAKKYVAVKTPVKRVALAPQPVYHAPAPVVQTRVTVAKKSSSDNGLAKRAFLRNIRAKIIANKKYPKLALRRHVEGSVKVRFDITQQGQVTNIRFINGKSIFQKSIRKTLARTFPVGIPSNMRKELPISDVSVILHFNIR